MTQCGVGHKMVKLLLLEVVVENNKKICPDFSGFFCI
jgi:hypothetical protein